MFNIIATLSRSFLLNARPEILIKNSDKCSNELWLLQNFLEMKAGMGRSNSVGEVFFTESIVASVFCEFPANSSMFWARL